jgi:hypothetical protein
MSHFYGTLKGARGEATRCGSASSGITATVASWSGAIRTMLYVDDAGNNCYRVMETPWHGAGQTRVIAEGVIGERT